MSTPNDLLSHVFGTLPSLATLATHYWQLTSDQVVDTVQTVTLGPVTDTVHKVTSLPVIPDIVRWGR